MTVPESTVTGSHLQPPAAEALWPTQIETQQESCIRCGSRKPLASERPPWAVLVARPCHSVAFQGQKAGELREIWMVRKAPGRRAPAPPLGVDAGSNAPRLWEKGGQTGSTLDQL